MKKLKKFVLNNAKVLSSEDLAAIEGGLNCNLVDTCTVNTLGEQCIYASSYINGYLTITIGECIITYAIQGTSLVAIGYCK